MSTPAKNNDTEEEKNYRQELKRLRQLGKMSQADLAQKMKDKGWDDYTQTTVSRMENGGRPITLSESRALAQILGTTVERMIKPLVISSLDAIAQDRANRLRESKASFEKELVAFWEERDLFFYPEMGLSKAENQQLNELLYKRYRSLYVSSGLWDSCLDAFQDEYESMREAANGKHPRSSYFPTLEEWVSEGLGIQPVKNHIDYTLNELDEIYSERTLTNE
ncbi:helix-turn-helix domain-containing protein [Rothia terrae]|uniref:Helix-turn-helix transcriptional regulator n=1 Tax=Rothia terrae TaxID=396015 RepID=A0A7H2BD10_9MICC|nr:helix-turn-helix transcriptional regulator [Rothia terrae]QNV37556.1 helix-turn-helix transcriptional regulator [Rothia terrae]